jgi:hypothetical protein
MSRLDPFAQYRLALELLDCPVTLKAPSGLTIDRLRYRHLRHVGYYERERKHLRDTIRQDLKKASGQQGAGKLPALP